MITFLHYFNIYWIFFLIDDRILSTIILFFSSFFIRKMLKRNLTVNIFSFWSKATKNKKIMYSPIYISVLLWWIVWFPREILFNMRTICILIIGLFIFKNKTSGKYFYLRHIVNDRLKIAALNIKESRIRNFSLRTKIAEDLFEILESDHFDVLKAS